ncbi:class I SAM-dependent methyltransferase [Rubrimonas cliftonensis]|uniref:Methyltransferase domain-containing protein n=1 Tax=Rubrimonas cliftonensis TaxID=89524 RepID=A0A1H4FE08_9RHOB|nr:methyltransferase domain-containing protein [Rubrimonas cliftonensis]SEA95505.1 Methyltransferase domain-containing protein [Rubrimonas cliftonensis]
MSLASDLPPAFRDVAPHAAPAPIEERGFEGAAHSPYLVARLAGQKPNLYGTVKFAVVAREIRRLEKLLGRPPRVLDLGCSTSISRHYLELNRLNFEYCGVDYEDQFSPDIVMDVRELDRRRDELPWTPDVIMLLDVLEHLPGRTQDIEAVMRACDAVIPPHGVVLVIAPQLYRLDRLKLAHLHYPEHQVRFTLAEWRAIVERAMRVEKVRGVGYLSWLCYLPMLSRNYREDNGYGRLFHALRGGFFEWSPFKPLEIALTRALGWAPFLAGWSNSSLLICRKRGAAATR